MQFKVECELWLRKTHSYQFSFEKFIQAARGVQAEQEDPDALEPFLEPLYGLQNWIKQQTKGNKTFYDWAVFFNDLTQYLQWPGIKNSIASSASN